MFAAIFGFGRYSERIIVWAHSAVMPQFTLNAASYTTVIAYFALASLIQLGFVRLQQRYLPVLPDHRKNSN